MKLLIPIIMFTLLIQTEKDSRIIWSQSEKLNWSDFLGTPNPATPFAASTNTGIAFQYKYTLDSSSKVVVDFTVESFFDKDKSWYFPHLIDDHILQHEQTHFDISELHARILRKRLSERRFTKNVENEIQTIYTRVEEQRVAMQRRFDAETNHSQNFKKEEHWRTLVAKQLEQHERWK